MAGGHTRASAAGSGPKGRSSRAARLFAWLAALAGLLHAASSAYWAAGGTWLLDTVGQWAVQLLDVQPVRARLGLAAIALLKGAAAVVPLLLAYRRLPLEPLWRGVSWVGAIGLIIYGGLNALLGNLVLSGALGPAGGFDRTARAGHAWLWDPLFLIWGAALLAYLFLSRTPAGREAGSQ